MVHISIMQKIKERSLSDLEGLFLQAADSAKKLHNNLEDLTKKETDLYYSLLEYSRNIYLVSKEIEGKNYPMSEMGSVSRNPLMFRRIIWISDKKIEITYRNGLKTDFSDFEEIKIAAEKYRKPSDDDYKKATENVNIELDNLIRNLEGIGYKMINSVDYAENIRKEIQKTKKKVKLSFYFDRPDSPHDYSLSIEYPYNNYSPQKRNSYPNFYKDSEKKDPYIITIQTGRGRRKSEKYSLSLNSEGDEIQKITKKLLKVIKE